jgi:Tol biopolymer transport system component
MTNQHVSSASVQADLGAAGDDVSVSDDGRYTAFASPASNLDAAADPNGVEDVFVHDNVTGATVLVSRDFAGGPANGPSRRPWLSGAGRYVVFQSLATDLVAVDTNGTVDVFRHDRDADADGVFDEPGAVATLLVSVSSGGAQANGPSRSYSESVSDDGDVVVFESDATNLAGGADSNGATDCFVRVISAGTTSRASVSSSGVEANGPTGSPAVSGNGAVVAFHSGTLPDNLAAGDTNLAGDVFTHDLATGATARVSVSSSGAQATGWSVRPSLSDDGLLVAFESTAPDLVGGDGNVGQDVFVRDTSSGTTTRVSVGSGGSEAEPGSASPRISGDGAVVVFVSDATDLVSGDTNGVPDVFVHDRAGVATARASRAVDGTQANGFSSNAAVSDDGSEVGFRSAATVLLGAGVDANGVDDVFLRGEPFTGPGGGGTPPPGWTYTILHPTGAAASWAYVTAGAAQAGFASFGAGAHAGTWSGTAASWTDLNPAGALDSSRIIAMAGGQQAGYATFPAGMHAGTWSGTAASWTDLNPPGALASVAHGTTGIDQGGYADFGTGFHAGTWSGAPASWVDLHPAAAAASFVWHNVAGQQVGGALFGGLMHASLWTGSAASWVDLTPPASASSACYATTGTQQAGYAEVGGVDHAGIWSGTATSFVDLNPPGAIASQLRGTIGTMQAGHASFGAGYNAGVWTGTAASWASLHALLPAAYTTSEARWISASGGAVAVVGLAFNSATGEEEAVLWTLGAGGGPPGAGADPYPVAFSVDGPVDPGTEGISFARGTLPAPPPLGPGNPLAFCVRNGPVPAPVPQAAGLVTLSPGDVLDYDTAGIPSEAVMFQSPPIAPAAPGPSPTPPDGTNNQILEATAMGLVAGPSVLPPLWMTVPPERDNVDAFSFGEDYFPPDIATFEPPMIQATSDWEDRSSVYPEPIVTDDAPGISFRFSVDPWAIGTAGASVLAESGGADAGSGCGTAPDAPWTSAGDAAGDVFGTPLLVRAAGATVGGGTNALVHDNPTLALAPSPPPLDPFEDDLDALECIGENTASWLFGGPALRPGNLHARVLETGPPDLPAPGASIHDPSFYAPNFFSVTRSSSGAPLSAVRTSFVVTGGPGADVFVTAGGTNLLFSDNAELGLMPDDDLDGLILKVCPEYRATVASTISTLLSTRGGDDPWMPYVVAGDTLAYTGGGMTLSVTKYLGSMIPEGCIEVGFSVTTDSRGMEYTGVDWEAGPVGGGVSSAAGDIFYAVIDGSPSNRNYLWYEETDLGEDAGAWVNGTSTDLAELSDNLDGLDSSETPPDTSTSTSVAPRDVPARPMGLRLERNAPNPFAARTTIRYALPHDSLVRLAVYDVRGRKVARLVDAVQPAGRHGVTWDGRDDHGGRLASGVYFARIEAAGEVQTRKLVMLR